MNTTTNKTTHTPGPWHASPGTNKSYNVLADKRYRAITASTAKANAQLIAAAPEMLVALRNLCNSIEMASDSMEMYQREYKYARQVIAKAEGRG